MSLWHVFFGTLFGGPWIGGLLAINEVLHHHPEEEAVAPQPRLPSMQRLDTWRYNENEAAKVYDGPEAEMEWYRFMEENEESCEDDEMPLVPRTRRQIDLDDDTVSNFQEHPFRDSSYFRGRGFRAKERGN